MQLEPRWPSVVGTIGIVIGIVLLIDTADDVLTLQWTAEDWETCGLSALWDIRSGRVLWAKGAHHVDEMQEVGKPVDEFLKEYG